MAEFTEYAPGTFCWTDLGTTDAGAAKAFYTALFGWEMEDTPAMPGMVYTMFYQRGKPAAALYPMPPEQRDQGIPPFWLSYVSVTDAAESAARARSLGGQVLREAMDVMDAGRIALIQDPTGAALALWQPKAHAGAGLANEPGALSWNELATKDVEKARDFYSNLFGWQIQIDQSGPMEYTVFLNGERMNGGAMQMTKEWGEIPPHWTVYFAVEDCDASVEKVKELGGQVMVEPMDILPGRMAVVQDPQGATFTIIKLNSPD